MLCMIHVMAETYGCLPSELLSKGDTFDMMVFDVAQTVREYKNKEKSGSTQDLYDQRELENYFRSVRG